MTLDSSTEVVAILYDIENAPFEMLDYTIGKAQHYQPCRTIVVSDWEATPEQKRWKKLLERPGFTFRQISRTYQGKNSLDSAIYDSAKLLYDEGVRRFFIITTDSDFVRIAEYLNSGTPSYIIGVGTKQASEILRNAYDEFLVYPPEEEKPVKTKATKNAKATIKTEKNAKESKTDKAAKATKSAKTAKTAKTTKAGKVVKEAEETKVQEPQEIRETKAAKTSKSRKTAKKTKAAEETPASLPAGELTVRIPRTLHQSLEERQAAEGVSMDELITYLLMRGMARWVED